MKQFQGNTPLPGPGNQPHNRMSPLGQPGQPMPGMPAGHPMPGPGGPPPIDMTHYDKMKCPECGSEILAATMDVVVMKKNSFLFQGPEVVIGMVQPGSGVPVKPKLVLCMNCGIIIDPKGKKAGDFEITPVKPDPEENNEKEA